MGFFDRLRAAVGARRISGVQLMQEQGTRYMAWNGKVYESDIVRACLRPKVKAVGKLVGKHIRESILPDGSRSIAVNPAPGIRRLLEEPNPLMTGQVLQEKLATQLCLNNNAFALIMRDDMGLPVAIYPLLPQTVEAIWSADGTLALRMQMPNSKIFTFDYRDILHLRQDFNEDDIFGTPIAPALAPLLNVVTTTDQGIVNAIKNSSVVRWLLKFTNSLKPTDLKKRRRILPIRFWRLRAGRALPRWTARRRHCRSTPRIMCRTPSRWTAPPCASLPCLTPTRAL